MKSVFLSHEQVFEHPLRAFEKIGAIAPACDLALLTAPDDGFVTEAGGGMNYYLAGAASVDRFGRSNPCSVCGMRPAILLEPGEEALLRKKRTEGGVTLAEYGTWPTTILDRSLRELAEKAYQEGSLRATGRRIRVRGEQIPVWSLGAKQIIALTLDHGGANGYLTLSDGTVVTEGELVFLELRPVRWIVDDRLLISAAILFSGLRRDEASEYLQGEFLRELADEADGEGEYETDEGFRVLQHDELSLIRAYVDADIPLFIHGLSGDGKSDRVRQVDPDVLDIELVNETPETINGRAVYNETKDEIVDVKPVWLVKLERICRDGRPHILFFDELTNATKQTQSVIFKIVLERYVNNRWPLPPNARIVAAGNDRTESSAAHDLAEPLFGRFAHLWIRTTVENWMPWAVRREINPFVMEFLANNDLYLRTPYSGTEGYADPRRWEMVSKALDASGNDFSLLVPIVGQDTADAFIKFFRAQRNLAPLGRYTDEELKKLSIARRYQLAQQCLNLAAAMPEEAEALVTRLGAEYLAWFRYLLARRRQLLNR
ncbi:MAG: hypothetical protein K6C12_01915 [Oscillospiraceae bacterium]|nr:hypothetical protein [Oscillospiraceae bacterium]